ncbi:hypothetical protein LOC67_21370 [Stieleria sp. JC731]|uniref:hypothetical protein n=1 Tax=Pirellulaceae TaxID=2691357 RepID=UPI001E5B6319|nr:hypothetical protein [Stieleria sp. JC731]MCC9603108.1 hypothetical protein [Stieleria sp. JC731]
MKLDVSDLFDRFYDVANIARSQFDFLQTKEGDTESRDWDSFCETLSDNLFLPACMGRAFNVTHIRMDASDVKSRLIAERRSENGAKIKFCRYLRPCFGLLPCFYAVADLDEPGSALTFRRPTDRLKLWLGKIPPSELKLDPPEYPTELIAPTRYFARQSIGFVSRSPRTDYYEFHGEWLLRQVEQCDASFVRREVGGQFRQMEGLIEISNKLFETMWVSAGESESPDGPW